MNEDLKAFAARFTSKTLKTFDVEPQLLTLRYSPDGKLLVAGGYDARVRRWDAATDQFAELSAIAGHRGWTQALAIANDSATVFSGDSYGELRATPLAGDNAAPRWKFDAAHDGWIRDATVSPDGNTLATCGRDRTVRFWNTSDGAKQGEIRGENDDLYCVRYSPDATHIVAGDRMGTAWHWEVASKKLVRKFDAALLYKLDRIQDVGGVRCLAFSKDGKQLAVGGMKPKNGATIQGVPVLLVFDFTSGALQHTFELGGVNDCDLMDVRLHEEGFFIAVTNGGPGAGKIVMQRLADKEPFFSSNAIANVQSLAWHPGGKHYAVFGTNNGSNGNGRTLDKDGKYPGNKSPVHVFAFGPASA